MDLAHKLKHQISLTLKDSFIDIYTKVASNNYLFTFNEVQTSKIYMKHFNLYRITLVSQSMHVSANYAYLFSRKLLPVRKVLLCPQRFKQMRGFRIAGNLRNQSNISFLSSPITSQVNNKEIGMYFTWPWLLAKYYQGKVWLPINIYYFVLLNFNAYILVYYVYWEQRKYFINYQLPYIQ